MKYKKNLLVTETEQQKKLKKKHGITDTDKIVVEKSNIVKFLINSTVNLTRTAAYITLFALATVGLTALIYPDTRIELNKIAQDVLSELNRLI